MRSLLKLVVTILFISVLSLAFSPSKAFAFQDYQFAFNNSTPILLAKGPSLISVSGSVDIVDDETFSNEVCNNLVLEDEFTLNEGESREVNFSKCCGGEVRVEIDLDAKNSSGDVIVTGQSRLYEGSSCNTNDLEKSQRISGTATPTAPLRLNIYLEDSGDSADIELDLVNSLY